MYTVVLGLRAYNSHLKSKHYGTILTIIIMEFIVAHFNFLPTASSLT